MSLSTFNKPFSLKINSSRQKQWLVLTPHLLILVSVLLNDEFSLWMRYLIILVVVNSAVYFSYLHISLRLGHSVHSISQDSAQNWIISTSHHNSVGVEVLSSSFVSNLLIIISYIGINKDKYTVLVLPDSLSKDEYRRLSVRLKMI